MSLDYLYQGAADDFIDELGAGTAGLALCDQATVGRVALREASGYRTMASSIIFGALQGPSRDSLLAKYVSFLLHGSGIEEWPVTAPLLEFRVARSPVRHGQAVSFLLPKGTRGAVTVFDATGRAVASAPVEAGAQRVDVRTELPSGTYVARLTGAGPASCVFSVVR
jgi:hypothetical protein